MSNGVRAQLTGSNLIQLLLIYQMTKGDKNSPRTGRAELGGDHPTGPGPAAALG
jgi:hypothetical protein